MNRKGNADKRQDDVVEQTPQGPLVKFVCTTASSVIIHPRTGTVILRGVRGEIREAKAGTELYDLLRHADAWQMDGTVDVVRPVSHRVFAPRPSSA